MIVLGIDPGIALTGYGFVRDQDDGDLGLVAYGVVSTPAHTPLETRLQQVYREVKDVVERYEPASAAIEKLLFGKNVTTAMAVGQARGVTMLALADCKIPISEYTPATIKQAVAGYGNAPKLQVQELVPATSPCLGRTSGSVSSSPLLRRNHGRATHLVGDDQGRER